MSFDLYPQPLIGTRGPGGTFTSVLALLAGMTMAVLTSGGCGDLDLESRRQTVIQAIWGRKGLPADDHHTVVERSAHDAELDAVMKNMDILDFDAGHGIRSRSHLFRARNPKKRLIVYVYGHHGSFLNDKRVIRKFLENGYDVMGFDLPMIGLNKGAVSFTLPSGKTIEVSNHKELVNVERRGLNPMSIFFTPIARGINHALGRRNYHSVDMTGISGGGWTTHVYAAVDTRIRRSYPVAGALPHDLRTLKMDRGDYEQFARRRLYKKAGFIELSVLAGTGPDRGQLQILNRFDSCCFRTDNREGQMLQFEAEIVDILARNGHGGKFALWIDDTHKRHKISDTGLKIILADLDAANGESHDAAAPAPTIFP